MKEDRYKFVVQHLLSPESVESKGIRFFSPHFPSTSKDEDFIEGELVIAEPDLKKIPSEKIKMCLESSFALSSGVYCPIDLTQVDPAPFSFDFNATAYCTYNLEKPNEVNEIWSRYMPLLLQDKHEFHHAINWFVRSLRANDPVDKFIYAWITLNCLYGYISNADGHHNGIKGIIYNNIPSMQIKKEITKKHRPIFEFLASLNLTDKRNKINWSNRLQTSLKTDNIDKIIETGISTIAIVRHTIFHGNVVDKKTEAERCIWPLNHLNAEILKNRLLLTKS